MARSSGGKAAATIRDRYSGGRGVTKISRHRWPGASSGRQMLEQIPASLPQRAREHRDRADRTNPEHERPLDEVADAANLKSLLETNVVCREARVPAARARDVQADP